MSADISGFRKEIAKVARTHLGYEDHGILTCFLTLDFGGASQGTPMYGFSHRRKTIERQEVVEPGLGEMVLGLMGACGVGEWSKVVGRIVYALFDWESRRLVGLAPLPTEPGRVFIFETAIETQKAGAVS